MQQMLNTKMCLQEFLGTKPSSSTPT